MRGALPKQTSIENMISNTLLEVLGNIKDNLTSHGNNAVAKLCITVLAFPSTTQDYIIPDADCQFFDS